MIDYSTDLRAPAWALNNPFGRARRHPRRRRTVVLLGKATFNYFAHLAKTAVRRAVVETPASRPRYYVGLAIMLVSWLPAYLYAYLPGAFPGGDTRIYILAVMDLAFVASVFLMGAEFWEKARRIFMYEGKV